MKELKGIDENTVIHCSTHAEWLQVRLLCKSNLADDEDRHIIGRFCYHIGRGYSNIEAYPEMKILPANDFIRLNTKPDLSNIKLGKEFAKSKIPEKWCVRRTPENAEVLNAWLLHRWKGANFDLKLVTWVVSDHYDGSFCSYAHGDGDLGGCWTTITFEQWQTIPENAEWLKGYNFEKFAMSCNEVFESSANDDLNGKKIEVVEVEEREIIGWKPSVPFKDNDLNEIHSLGYKYDNYYSSPKHSWTREIFERLIEYGVYVPVYREIERPVFKVGDWANFEGTVFEIWSIQNEANRQWLKKGNGTSYLLSLCRHATPEEIEAARPKEIWERYPTWDSIGCIDGFHAKGTTSEICQNTGLSTGKDNINVFALEKQVQSAHSFAMLSQIEKAWNEGKKGSWTVALVNGRLMTRQTLTYSAHINFVSETLAEKSLELHGDLWCKFYMV